MSERPGELQILSHHRFTRPRIRFWLPVVMMLLVLLCGWYIAPRVSVLDVVALLFLLYIAISALVSIGEITVAEEGMVIDRLLLPRRFIPWQAINRVIIYAHETGEIDAHIEIASISVHEGLSPLNRLPGLVYGQGWRQTILITPDTLENYDTLLVALEAHSPVLWRRPR